MRNNQERIEKGEIEMTKRNTAGDFGSPKWKEDFLTEESLDSIIDSTDIEDYEFHRIEKSYTVDDDRVGAIVQIKKGGRTKRVIIDFQRGKSTWEQLMDITFNIGNGSDSIIAVHGDGRNVEDENNDADEFLVPPECFVNVLLAYKVEAYLVRAERQSCCQDYVTYEYSCNPKKSSETFSGKLPSKKQFEKAEFWNLHWESNLQRGCERLYNLSDWFTGGRTGYTVNGLELVPKWSDRGFFLLGIPDSTNGVELLEWLWKNKRQEFRNEYEECKIKMYKKNGRPSKLSIQLSDMPFKEVLLSDFRGRTYYGDYAFSQECFLGETIENLLDDMPVVTWQ
jgi:hypothetical protein